MKNVKGRVWKFGDHVDTDQIIPAERLTSDNNDKLGFLGGINWTSPNERSTVAVSLISSNEQVTGENVRNEARAFSAP